MVRVKVARSPEGTPLSVEISGHSRFGSHGSDIVCAAVSALVQTTVFAMEDLLELPPGGVLEEGYAYLTLPGSAEPAKREQQLLLLETLLLGLREIEKTYPGYIRYLEVQAGTTGVED